MEGDRVEAERGFPKEVHARWKPERGKRRRRRRRRRDEDRTVDQKQLE